MATPHTAPPMTHFTLHPVANPAGASATGMDSASPITACRVRDAQGQWVGSLKLVGGRWKFKAVGHADDGGLIPGGGPYTHRHNTVFEALDADAVGAGLLGGGG